MCLYHLPYLVVNIPFSVFRGRTVAKWEVKEGILGKSAQITGKPTETIS